MDNDTMLDLAAVIRGAAYPLTGAAADYDRLLDQIGGAARRLELSLGGDALSPFAEAMTGAMAAVDALSAEIEQGYKTPLR